VFGCRTILKEDLLETRVLLLWEEGVPLLPGGRKKGWGLERRIKVI